MSTDQTPPLDMLSFKAIRRASASLCYIEDRQSDEVWSTLSEFNVPP